VSVGRVLETLIHRVRLAGVAAALSIVASPAAAQQLPTEQIAPAVQPAGLRPPVTQTLPDALPQARPRSVPPSPPPMPSSRPSHRWVDVDGGGRPHHRAARASHRAAHARRPAHGHGRPAHVKRRTVHASGRAVHGCKVTRRGDRRHGRCTALLRHHHARAHRHGHATRRKHQVQRRSTAHHQRARHHRSRHR